MDPLKAKQVSALFHKLQTERDSLLAQNKALKEQLVNQKSQVSEKDHQDVVKELARAVELVEQLRHNLDVLEEENTYLRTERANNLALVEDLSHLQGRLMHLAVEGKVTKSTSSRLFEKEQRKVKKKQPFYEDALYELKAELGQWE